MPVSKKRKEKGLSKPRGGICAPGNFGSAKRVFNKKTRKVSLKRFTCFDRKSLLKIIKKLNAEEPFIYNPNASEYELWNLIREKMKGKCRDEICWAKEGDVDTTDIFKPQKPKAWEKNALDWLDTNNIEDVLSQYEKKHPNFVFMGAVPIDFDHRFSNNNCVANELCNLSVKRLVDNGKTRLGVVFNLDKHDQPGSHWIAMFARFGRKSFVGYFDSYGYKPPREVQKLMRRIKVQCEEMGRECEVRSNDIRHQRKFSECGMYCIHFIVKMLEGGDFDQITKNIIDDDTMNSYRQLFFN